MIEQLMKEVRVEFQIPPYFPDEGLKNYIEEGIARLTSLNPYADLEKDGVGRSLLKNYVDYAYHHRIDDWERNYQSLIISWQMGSEINDTAADL